MAITLMKNGRCTHSTAAIVSVVDELLGLRSLDGANACAGTAVDAFISVDDELAIFFSNCIGRAFAFAGTASDAIIGNDISHCFHLQVFPGAANMTLRSDRYLRVYYYCIRFFVFVNTLAHVFCYFFEKFFHTGINGGNFCSNRIIFS
jgi:hypothetical protein